MSKTGDLRVDSIMPRLFKSWETLPFEECLLDRTVSYKKLKKKDIKQIGKIPVVDQGENFISGYTDNESDAYAGTLPVIIFGDHTRRVKYIGFKFAVGADGTKLLHPFKALYPKFFFFYLSTLKLESQGYSRHYRFLKQINIPIPPLNEQNRIVAKLEKLLTKVDACKERLGKIPIILKRFRQSVLAAACSGRLTADWRGKNSDVESASELLKWIQHERKKKGLSDAQGMQIETDDLPNSWSRIKLSIFIESMANGIYKPKKFYSEDGIVCLRMYNIQDGKIVWKDLKRMLLTSEEIDKFSLRPGDILVNRVNSRELVGKAAIIEKIEEPVVFESKNIRLRLNKKYIMPEYVNYCFLTRIVRDVFEGKAKQTVGMATISQPEISNLILPIPPLNEQQEIVRRVEALFKVADQIEDRHKKAKAYVDKLTQSILAKAFRGELMPQDPNDEPASVLLERIREERAKKQVKSQTRKTKARRRQRLQNQLQIDI